MRQRKRKSQIRQRAIRRSVCQFEELESRQLLHGAWGLYPQLIGLDDARNDATLAQYLGDGLAIADFGTGVMWDPLQPTHPGLAGGIWTNTIEQPGNQNDEDQTGELNDMHGWNFTNDSANIYRATGNIHGTQTAAIIVGNPFHFPLGGATPDPDYAPLSPDPNIDGRHFEGIARNSTVIPLVIDGDNPNQATFNARVAAGLDWIDRALSHGHGEIVAVNMPFNSTSTTEQQQALAALYGRVFLAASAGNAATDRLGFPNTYRLPDGTFPVVTVGSSGLYFIRNAQGQVTETREALSDRTAYGPRVDLLAPSYRSIVADNDAANTWYHVHRSTDTLDSATSWSVPQVAATAALIEQIDRAFASVDFSPDDILQILRITGDPVTQRRSGNNFVTDRDNNQAITYRRLNVYRALQEAYRRTDANAPTVRRIVQPPDRARTHPASIDIVMSEQVNTTDLRNALRLTFNNDTANLLNPSATIQNVSGATYRISNLTTAALRHGRYTLSLDPTMVHDLAGNAGVGVVASTAWLVDLQADLRPTLLKDLSGRNGRNLLTQKPRLKTMVGTTLRFRGFGEPGGGQLTLLANNTVISQTVQADASGNFPVVRTNRPGYFKVGRRFFLWARVTDDLGNSTLRRLWRIKVVASAARPDGMHGVHRTRVTGATIAVTDFCS